MRSRAALLSLVCAAALGSIPLHVRVQAGSPWLVRRYRAGETLVYNMTATNRGKNATTHYEARASAVVKTDSAGTFFEEYAWSDLRVNDRRIALPSPSLRFRQRLSLAPAYRLAIPDLGGIHPALVGPVVDLLTFYADVQMAMREPALAQAGDHVYVNDGGVNSWADGRRILTGEDAIDFDITLAEVNLRDSIATLVVRHVPPAHPAIAAVAPWMRAPVEDTPNNWVQVARSDSGGYVASVGKESFVATIRLSLVDGRVLTAALDNSVNVMERECRDSSLSRCGPPVRYTLTRRIEIDEGK